MIEFKAAPAPVFRSIKSRRAVVDGKHPLDGWRHLSSGNTSVVRKGGIVVVLVPQEDGNVAVTTYWDADDKAADAILACVRGKVTWDAMWASFGEQLTWSGGPEMKSETETFYYLATGAEA